LNHYIKTILVGRYFFSSTIGLVGGGFMVVSFLLHQIVVSFCSNRITKDASLEQTNFMTQKQKLS
jgi:hypothetical protein